MSNEKFVSEEPELGSPESTEDVIRTRAYQLYEQRGREDGHDLDDWLHAEADMAERKASESVTAPTMKARRATAA